MSQTTAPSLFGNTQQIAAMGFDTTRPAKSLLDVMYDGFYLLFLLKDRRVPANAETFTSQIHKFLEDVERAGKKLPDVTAEDLYAAKYAFCAAVDESVLVGQPHTSTLRANWERKPLQLALFGDHLAGENFFTKLDALRQQGSARVQVLEVFYVCLLLGFQGKYFLDGPEKLGFLTARLGEEIAQRKGKRAGFAPAWELPDRVSHTLKRETPVWVFASVFGALGLLAFVGLRFGLGHGTAKATAPFENVVNLPPRAANVTITLP